MSVTAPSVSVVMPVYNVERYLAQAIDSVLAQSFADFELIIVDDGSTDGSAAIYERYRDSRIRIVRQSNRGLPGARNTGIRVARGKYIALLDSDDAWLPHKLERHVAHLDRRPVVGISYSGSAFMDANGRLNGLAMRPKLTNITSEDVFCRNPIGNGSAPVFRREVFDSIAFLAERGGVTEMCYFDESFRYAEDIECWMRIALSTDWRIEGLDECLTLYRVVHGTLSANTESMYEHWCRMLDKVIVAAPEFAERHAARARGYQLRYYARRMVKEGAGPKALTYLQRALRAYPRMLLEEPVKTAITAAAALCLRVTSPGIMTRIESIVGTVLVACGKRSSRAAAP